MQKTLREIARLIGGELVGDGSLVITGVSGIKEARPGDITFLANPKYAPYLEKTRASAVITSQEIESAAKPIIRTQDPSLAFTRILEELFPSQVKHPQGIHPSAVIGKNAKIGRGAAVGAYAVIEEGVSIGDRTVVYAGCYIGRDTLIGKDSLLYPHVCIREGISIGERVIIHSGAVIGSDGFGFIPIEGQHRKIPQVGTVVIEDDVEIGANTAIDRARFGKTVVGRGTKIDNLVHIAHNVMIGENALIIAQVGISGSTVIGKGATLAGQAGLVGHITIGEGAIIAAQAGVTKSVPANTLVSGYPAQEHAHARRINACIQNLPRLYESVKKITARIEEIESTRKKE